MDQLFKWLRDHLWVAGTGGTAAVVFLITFFAVSAATGDDSPPPPLDQAVSSTPSPPGTLAEPPALEEPDSPAGEPVEPLEAEPDPPAKPEPDDVQVEPDLESDRESEPALVRPGRPLPDFDESTLIHGGSGAQGAILGGPGIVLSSGADRRTPWELIIPSAMLRADIVKVGLTWSGAFGAPDNPEVIGWWEDGPEPGESGNVLLDGHRDFTDTSGNVGTGVCWLLPNTVLGDFVIVRDHDAQMHYLYVVIETTSIPWDAPNGVEYLQRSDRAILTLITCEGSFDRDAHNYSNRRIVVAELTDSIPFGS